MGGLGRKGPANLGLQLFLPYLASTVSPEVQVSLVRVPGPACIPGKEQGLERARTPS